MSNAIDSNGTLLQAGDGATPTEAFTTIAEVLDISGPSLSLETEDVTSHDSGGNAEYIGTILDGGEVSFEINYIPGNATHNATAGLLKTMTDKAVRNFKLVFPTASPVTWQFTALVTGFEPAAPAKGKLTASVTLKVTGAPTLV